MKAALCFIISYEHILNKEELWKEWIEPNKDIINVYFYYKDFNKIKSQWIREHTIPPNFIHETSYYHVIPAYLSLMRFALLHDAYNSWFCMLQILVVLLYLQKNLDIYSIKIITRVL